MPFHRFGHLKVAPLVKVGDIVKRGSQLGYVGATGHAEGPHLHYDIFKERPASFFEYVRGLSGPQVSKIYLDPALYMKDGYPAVNSLRTGYSFLQWTGGLFHPGVDINSPNDLGKPFFSPVNGKVVFVSAPKNGASDHGWGNMVVVEEDRPTQRDVSFGLRLAGRFLLAVEDHGRLWYVDIDGKKHNVGITPEECSQFLRRIAEAKIPLGITNQDLDKIPLA